MPNPDVEKPEAKILLETLESIPRSYDVAKIFYQEDIAPIFEVILPMTSSHASIDNVYQYYCDFVVGKEHKRIGGRNTTIADWIGSFRPKRINVIPLFEDRDSMLNAHTILRRYLHDKDLAYQRVFLARSDPAMNYGLISAVLLNKIALQRFHTTTEKIGIRLYPIIGVGSAPFRGNLCPGTTGRVTAEYPSVQTFTIQSAFKYDHPLDEVRDGIIALKQHKASSPQEVDEARCLGIVGKYTNQYIQEIIPLADIINRISAFIPTRRKRKLHTGLFGYPRSIGGITLPRAITFTASLYSIGLPPEVLGLSALDAEDIAYIRKVYVNFDEDLKDALRYLNPDSRYLAPGIMAPVEALFEIAIDKEHKAITDTILHALDENLTGIIQGEVLRAATIRKFLG